MQIRVEDLPADITERQLEIIFTHYGDVERIAIDRRHPQGRTFALVSMPEEPARLAIRCLRGVGLAGRSMHVYTD